MPVVQFTGLASGIDSASLVDALIEARETTNQLRRAEIEFIESETDALEELNTKILALSDLVDQFSTLNGGGISKKAESTDTSVATASAGSDAINSSFDLTVNTIADNATVSIEDSYASLSAFYTTGGDTTLQIDVGGTPISHTVNITSSVTTLQDVINDINSSSTIGSLAVASGVNVGTESSPDYRIMITSLNTGTDEGSLTVTDGAAGTTITTDQATNSEFTISGIAGTITRQSNTVNDVITGVTFQIQDTGSATISVSDDSDETAEKMQEILDSYNEVVDFIDENDTVERVESGQNIANVFGSLAKTSIDNDFLTSFRTSLSTATSSNGTSVASMAELGIKTNRDGTLEFDVDDFKEAISSDSVGAGEVIRDFADDLSGISGVLSQFTKFNGFIDIAQESNASEIELLNSEINQKDRSNQKLRETLELRFSKLESTVSKLQSQESALSGILAGL